MQAKMQIRNRFRLELQVQMLDIQSSSRVYETRRIAGIADHLRPISARLVREIMVGLIWFMHSGNVELAKHTKTQE
jgi:hypothetical protein